MSSLTRHGRAATHSEIENDRFLQWVHKKHRHQGSEFVKALVDGCATEFAAHTRLGQDERAAIYKRLRENLQHAYDGRLRKHVKIHCCS